jgi:hypothetical protein
MLKNPANLAGTQLGRNVRNDQVAAPGYEWAAAQHPPIHPPRLADDCRRPPDAPPIITACLGATTYSIDAA